MYAASFNKASMALFYMYMGRKRKHKIVGEQRFFFYILLKICER